MATETTTTTIAITTTTPERRQIARVLHFDAILAEYINWDAIGRTARELGAHLEARTHQDSAQTITLFWTYTDGD